MNWSSLLNADLQLELEKIFRTAESDFKANTAVQFTDSDLQDIVSRAKSKLYASLELKPVKNTAELAAAWNQLVTEFHRNAYWNFSPATDNQLEKKIPKKKSKRQSLGAYLKAFLVPTLLLKAAILYFGLNYSQYPDEGYGWGLIIVIFLSLCNFAIFIWKNRHASDEEPSGN